VVAWLIERTGNAMVPAWYMLVTTFAAIIGVWGLRPHAEVATRLVEVRLAEREGFPIVGPGRRGNR
jgi:hypothetical protein